jgi:hypothetical protein
MNRRGTPLVRIAPIVVAGLFLVLGLSQLAAASSVGPYQPPSNGDPNCPPAPLLDGTSAANGSLVALWQPDPLSGTACALPPAATIEGAQIIVGIYTPSTPSGGIVPISVEEFTTASVTVYVAGPNNTTVPENKLVQQNVLWSNATVPASAGELDEFNLNVPPQFSAENITVGILGLVLSFTIHTPKTALPVPYDYGQVILLLIEILGAAFVVFVSGVGVAHYIVQRVRHVNLVKPAVVVLLTIVFAVGYIVGNFRQFLYWVGDASLAWVFIPFFLAGIVVWMAVLPTKAPAVGIVRPAIPLTRGKGSMEVDLIRVYGEGPIAEYIAPGTKAGIGRFFGVRSVFDATGLTPTPWIVADPGFKNPRKDVKEFYFTWADVPGQAPNFERRAPKFWLFPWRKSVAEKRAEWREKVGLDLINTEKTGIRNDGLPGFLFSFDPGICRVAALGEQGVVLQQGWCSGTANWSSMGIAHQRMQTAVLSQRWSEETRIRDSVMRHLTLRSIVHQAPGSPRAVVGLDEMSRRQIAREFDTSSFVDFLDRRWLEDQARRHPKPAKEVTSTNAEATNPVPPHLRKGSPG